MAIVVSSISGLAVVLAFVFGVGGFASRTEASDDVILSKLAELKAEIKDRDDKNDQRWEEHYREVGAMKSSIDTQAAFASSGERHTAADDLRATMVTEEKLNQRIDSAVNGIRADVSYMGGRIDELSSTVHTGFAEMKQTIQKMQSR